VPFEATKGAVLIPGMISGKGPFTFGLDTGTNPSSIDLALARELKLPLGDVPGEGEGFGTQKPEVWETTLSCVRLGELEVAEVPALAGDLSQLASVIGTPWHGVLGYSLLRDRITQIDYSRKIVRFFERTLDWHAHPTYRSSRDLVFHMHLVDPWMIPVIEGVRVNGQPVRALIDTGNGGGFHLTHACAAQLGLAEQYKTWSTRDAYGYAGKGSVYKGTVQEVTVGDVTIQDAEVWVEGQGQGWEPPLEYAGINIGNGVLRDYVVTFDYLNQTLHLGR
jgi:predicted aspartyl protease